MEWLTVCNGFLALVFAGWTGYWLGRDYPQRAVFSASVALINAAAVALQIDGV